MPLNITGTPSLNTRLYFSKSGTTKPASGGEFTITLRKPTTRETFFRRLRNALTFGAWTPLVSNRKDWQAFRAAVTSERLARFQQNHNPHQDTAALNKVMNSIETAFSTYSTTQRLTSSKASEIMNLIERDMASGTTASTLAQAPAGGPTKLSQGLIARGLHTLDQRQHGREYNSHVTSIDNELAGLSSELDKMDLGNPVEIDLGEMDDSQDGAEPASLSTEEKARFDLQSMKGLLTDNVSEVRNILKLGYGFDGPVLNSGMKALQAQFSSHADKNLIYPGSESWSLQGGVHAPLRGQPNPCGSYLQEVADQLSQNQAVKNQLENPVSTSSIVAIPLGLQSGRSATHENHSVLVALDLKDRRVLYLDAKGESPRAAERNYSNTQGLQEALERLGKSVFGSDWNPSTGMAMLSNAKQQGANDCIAFTQDFTRRLLEGQTVADIDRTMGEIERDGRSPPSGDGPQVQDSSEMLGIRARMARDIIDHVLQPRIKDFKDKVVQWCTNAASDAVADRNSFGSQA